MGDLPAPRGVTFAPPPIELRPSLRDAINSAVASLEPGKTGALVILANEQGANAVVVAKLHGTWEVQAWVGKRWSETLAYGASLRTTW